MKLNKYYIEFIANMPVWRTAPQPDAFHFAPKGGAQGLQRLAWRFLQWRGALNQAERPVLTIDRHLIDADTFIERLYKQKWALLDDFGVEGRRLLIGSEDYFEMMREPAIHQHFEFKANVRVFSKGRLKELELDVEVVPWMRGAVVMP